MKFSVVMPIHNEADRLPLSSPTVYRLMSSEVILIFDNCSNDSEQVAKKIIRKYNPLDCINDVPKKIEHKQ